MTSSFSVISANQDMGKHLFRMRLKPDRGSQVGLKSLGPVSLFSSVSMELGILFRNGLQVSS